MIEQRSDRTAPAVRDGISSEQQALSFSFLFLRRSQHLLCFLVQALDQRVVKFRHLDRCQVSAA